MHVGAISVHHFLQHSRMATDNYVVACLVMMFMLALIYECLMCLKILKGKV